MILAWFIHVDWTLIFLYSKFWAKFFHGLEFFSVSLWFNYLMNSFIDCVYFQLSLIETLLVPWDADP